MTHYDQHDWRYSCVPWFLREFERLEAELATFGFLADQKQPRTLRLYLPDLPKQPSITFILGAATLFEYAYRLKTPLYVSPEREWRLVVSEYDTWDVCKTDIVRVLQDYEPLTGES